VSKNLFETYEVNGKTYTDNLGENTLISIPKKQYIEYEQQKEETERLQARIDKALHRIQLLQMDGEVSIKDLGKIVRDLRGSDKEWI